MLTIHVWPKRLKEFLLTHPLYKSPSDLQKGPTLADYHQRLSDYLPMAALVGADATYELRIL